MLIEITPREGLMVQAKINMHDEPRIHRWVMLSNPFVFNSSPISIDEQSEPKILLVNITSSRPKLPFDLTLDKTDIKSLKHKSYLAYEDSQLITSKIFNNILNSNTCNKNKISKSNLDNELLDRIIKSFLNYSKLIPSHKIFLISYLKEKSNSQPVNVS